MQILDQLLDYQHVTREKRCRECSLGHVAVHFAGLFLFLFQHLAVQASSGSRISQLEADG